MPENKFAWNFEKVEKDYIYDTLNEYSNNLKNESLGIFEPIITIMDLANDSRVYGFHIGVPELNGFTWRLFEVNAMSSGNKFEVTFPSVVHGAITFKGKSTDDLINSIQKIINENEVKKDLALYYNRVVVKRKQREDYEK
jgi:hypothetical protein